MWDLEDSQRRYCMNITTPEKENQISKRKNIFKDIFGSFLKIEKELNLQIKSAYCASKKIILCSMMSINMNSSKITGLQR